MTDQKILSQEQMEILDEVAKATTLVQQARADLDILEKKKLTIGDEIEAEVKERVAKVLQLSSDAVLQIKANGREVASIKNSIQDLFTKVLEFADDVLKRGKDFDKYRKTILADFDKLTLQIQEEQVRIDDQNRTIKQQWIDIDRIRKDQDSREKLIYSRRAALDAAVREFDYKEQDGKRRLKIKKGKTK